MKFTGTVNIDVTELILNLENVNIPTVRIVEIINPTFATVDLQYPKVKQGIQEIILMKLVLL